ncbi:hypothetical protein PR048_023250 [Dryococelus australis]|uniref:Uncharacterized protein n=1 Tax=Dryococelus australis TaxID=614101 RepID=A0ABQ9GTL5_9NEOP|nr:hypothetical protein PR048_023250 [Dryococelus australis]
MNISPQSNLPLRRSMVSIGVMNYSKIFQLDIHFLEYIICKAMMTVARTGGEVHGKHREFWRAESQPIETINTVEWNKVGIVGAMCGLATPKKHSIPIPSTTIKAHPSFDSDRATPTLISKPSPSLTNRHSSALHQTPPGETYAAPELSHPPDSEEATPKMGRRGSSAHQEERVTAIHRTSQQGEGEGRVVHYNTPRLGGGEGDMAISESWAEVSVISFSFCSNKFCMLVPDNLVLSTSRCASFSASERLSTRSAVQMADSATQIAHSATRMAHSAMQMNHPATQIAHPAVQIAHYSIQMAHSAKQMDHYAMRTAHSAMQMAHHVTQMEHHVTQIDNDATQMAHHSKQMARHAMRMAHNDILMDHNRTLMKEANKLKDDEDVELHKVDKSKKDTEKYVENVNKVRDDKYEVIKVELEIAIQDKEKAQNEAEE